VKSAKCPKVKVAEGQEFVDWVLSPKGQKIIDDYKIKGQQAFFANAK
jgi:tungstate transport system substrate-binding protein